MTIYIHGTDYVREWFGHRMKKNLINKRATCFSRVLSVGGFTLFVYSKISVFPPECTYSGLGVGLTALTWSTLIAIIRRGYKPLPEVQFENDILLDILGDEVFVTIDSENATDRLVDVLRRGNEILADVKQDLQMHKKDIGNLIQLMETGECSAYRVPTTTLYFRMFSEISAVIHKYELDVQPGELDSLPIIDFDTRPAQSKVLLKKIEDVFLGYMYAVERLRFGLRRYMTPEFIRENITRKRRQEAIKMMMTFHVPKKKNQETVELVQFLDLCISARMINAGHLV